MGGPGTGTPPSEMSARGLMVLGAFVAVIAVILLAIADMETGAAAALIMAFAAYSAFVLHGAHRARSRH